MSLSRRWALMHERRGAPEPALEELLDVLSPCDLMLVEGFKRDPIPKIEVHRSANAHQGVVFPGDRHIMAIATDAPIATRLPRFALDNVEAIAECVLGRARRILLRPLRACQGEGRSKTS